RGADDTKTVGRSGDTIAVAHPDGIAFPRLPGAFEQGGSLRDEHLRPSELTVVSGLDAAAELERHRLLSITDAEHRDAGLIDRHRGKGGIRVAHRGRPAGENPPFRAHRHKGGLRLSVRHDLAIDLLLAHPAGDELGHLRAEIDNEDFVVAGAHYGFSPGCNSRIEDGHPLLYSGVHRARSSACA